MSVTKSEDQIQLDNLMNKVYEAQKEYAKYSQEEVDKIFKHVALVANENRLELARMAYDEAGMGSIEDKIIKNHYASEVIYNAYKDMKSCGVVERNEEAGYSIYAEPLGILAGIVPCTNPTSTTIFKILLALKTRNAIVFSPHPRTVKCTVYTVNLLHNAAVEAGAPRNIIGAIENVSIELCNYLMKHPMVSQIVATGAGGLVKAAYSSGKPCIGGGAGNTPAIIDETADISMAVNSILQSKTFDNGMICASEQSAITVKSISPHIREEFVKRGAYFIESDEDKKKLSDFIFNEQGGLNPKAVGQSAEHLAVLSGIPPVPKGTRVLIVNIRSIGPEEPFSREKLCPVLGFLEEDDFESALDAAHRLVKFGGMGHTSCLYTDLNGANKQERISKYEATMPAGRTLICMPTSHGGIGRLYNPCQIPSLSLGCGSWGGNSSAEGLQPKHLLNYKQVAERRNPAISYSQPLEMKFGPQIIHSCFEQISNLQNIKNVAILFEKFDDRSYGRKELEQVKSVLQQSNLNCMVYDSIEKPLTVQAIKQTVDAVNEFRADMIVALGDSTVIECAKVVRSLMEEPNQNLKTLSSRFMSMGTKIETFKRTGKKYLISIPLTSGSGAEMTPFSYAVCKKKAVSYTFCDLNLLSDMSIVDYSIVSSMPEEIVAKSGMNALCNALESYVALNATDYTRSQSYEAFELLCKNIMLAYTDKSNASARGFMHRAASLAGLAIGNTFYGLCEAIAQQIVARYSLNISLVKAAMIIHVIKFNATEAPTKLGTSPTYERPKALEQYAQMARKYKLSDDRKSNEESVEKLISYITNLKTDMGITNVLKSIEKSEFMKSIDDLAIKTFDSQYASTCPRYPLISEIKQLLTEAYEA